MASGPELVGRLGLDKSNYANGLKAAESDFKNFSNATRSGTAAVNSQLGEMNYKLSGVRDILHGFGYLMVFDRFIAGFKELSEWATKFGDKTDGNIQAAARWGNAWKESTEDAKKGGAEALGALTMIGERVGGMLKGESVGEVAAGIVGENAALAAEAKAAALKKANPRLDELRAQYAKEVASDELKTLNAEERQNVLTDRMNGLLEQMRTLNEDDLDYATKKVTLQGQIHSIEEAIRKSAGEGSREEAEYWKQFYADVEEAEKMAKDAEEKAEQAHSRALQRVQQLKAAQADAQNEISGIKANQANKEADKSKLTLGQLAGLDVFSSGVSVEAGQQGEKARQIMDLTRQAKESALKGDVSGSSSLNAQAQAMADALHAPGGLLKSTEMPGSEMSAQLETANRHLEAIDQKLAGKFAATE